MLTILTQRAMKLSAISLIRARHRFLGKKLPKPEIYYFAYGANLDPKRFERYQANAEPVGVARLDGYSLKFSMPCEYKGKGYASIEEDAGKVVWGFLYKLDRFTLALLDVSEYKFLRHYDRIQVRVQSVSGQEYEGFAYKTPFSREGLIPSTEYKNLISAAAKKHGFPNSYISRIEEFPSRESFDLDPGYSILFPNRRRPLEKILRAPYLLHDSVREKLCDWLRF